MTVSRAVADPDRRPSALAGGGRTSDGNSRSLARPARPPRAARSTTARGPAGEPSNGEGERRARSATHGAQAAPQSPQSKEGIVARLFEAFSRRDLDTTLALVHPKIVFQPITAEVTQGGEPYRGYDGIRRYLSDVEAHWDELTVHPAQIRAAGRAVVVLGLVSGSGPAGSFENAPTTWVVKFEDGLVVHAQIFSDRRHVLEALGVEEA